MNSYAASRGYRLKKQFGGKTIPPRRPAVEIVVKYNTFSSELHSMRLTK